MKIAHGWVLPRLFYCSFFETITMLKMNLFVSRYITQKHNYFDVRYALASIKWNKTFRKKKSLCNFSSVMSVHRNNIAKSYNFHANIVSMKRVFDIWTALKLFWEP
jgi:hypothetical protein